MLRTCAAPSVCVYRRSRRVPSVLVSPLYRIFLNFIIMDALQATVADVVTRLDDLDSYIKDVSDRVSTQESKLDSRFSQIQHGLDDIIRRLPADEQGVDNSAGAHRRQIQPTLSDPSTSSGTTATNYDVQAEFISVKESLTKVVLPPEFVFPESSLPVKGDLAKAKVSLIRKSGSYVNTALKFLGNLDEHQPVSVSDLGALYTVLAAHNKFLQSELTAAVGEGFGIGKDTANLFRALKSNSSFFNAQDALAFENAVRITGAVALSQQTELLQKLVSPQRGRGGKYFGRWRGQRGRGSNRSSDFFEDSVSSLSKDKPRSLVTYIVPCVLWCCVCILPCVLWCCDAIV